MHTVTIIRGCLVITIVSVIITVMIIVICVASVHLHLDMTPTLAEVCWIVTTDVKIVSLLVGVEAPGLAGRARTWDLGKLKLNTVLIRLFNAQTSLNQSDHDQRALFVLVVPGKIV